MGDSHILLRSVTLPHPNWRGVGDWGRWGGGAAGPWATVTYYSGQLPSHPGLHGRVVKGVGHIGHVEAMECGRS